MKKLAMVGLMMSVMTTAGMALASNWVRIDTQTPAQEPKCTVSFDIDTASWSRNVGKAWGRHVANPSHSACPKHDYKEQDGLMLFDCDNRMEKTISVLSEDWNGKRDQTDKSDDQWTNVVPGTILEEAYDFVCSHMPRK